MSALREAEYRSQEVNGFWAARVLLSGHDRAGQMRPSCAGRRGRRARSHITSRATKTPLLGASIVAPW